MVPFAFVIIVDNWIHIFVIFALKDYVIYSILFVICHWISLFWINWLYFEGDLVNLIFNFGGEWVDIFSQAATTIVYNIYSTSDDKQTVLIMYWVFILIQLSFWTLPLMALRTSRNNIVMAKHILYLDIFTDIPLVMITLISGAWKVQLYILIDLFVKLALMARGVTLNGCYYIGLPAKVK